MSHLVAVNSISTSNTSLASFYNIWGRSLKMKQLFKNIKKVASSPNATVLILGESGTGKELVARAIHNSSLMAEKPFIEINSTALPDNLLETELFGYESGAFTEANRLQAT